MIMYFIFSPSKGLKVLSVPVMSNQEAYNCIGELDDAQEAAEELIEEALSRESYDDVSCIVVVFH
ncbi:putative protein phosphatase 2C 28 [Prunus yedoensis var. nudiflora]|uniref:Protein-serine/threonine phosphatase n=1 Tax=Prunus yedoensis var. nudiflora TaxID=2094558 RepID=A0A314V3Q9_PRUYE|nr:putative protein phosphatase 2C 28 [Prunus yedoensis var. nudiflora]